MYAEDEIVWKDTDAKLLPFVREATGWRRSRRGAVSSSTGWRVVAYAVLRKDAPAAAPGMWLRRFWLVNTEDPAPCYRNAAGLVNWCPSEGRDPKSLIPNQESVNPDQSLRDNPKPWPRRVRRPAP